MMAENKKSFIAYSNWYEMIKYVPDEIAGRLFKHIFSYVNDEHPETDDWQINALFGQIKVQLKDDLKKWEHQREQRSDAGKKSAEARATKFNERSNSLNEKARNSTVNVNVNVNDNVINNKEYKKMLLSQIAEADLEEPTKTYFKVALSFHEMFKKIATEAGGSINQLSKAKGTWIDDIRMMIEIDKISIENIRRVWHWLQTNDFWKKNIQSTANLRKQFNKLIIEVNHERTKANHSGLSEQRQEEWRNAAERLAAKIDERDRNLAAKQV